MTLDPRLLPLVDVLVEVVARDLANENAVAPTKENDGVKDSRHEQNTPSRADSTN